MDRTLDHEGISQADLDRVQEIIRLRVINAKLLAALEETVELLADAGLYSPLKRARDVIQEAKK